jgi:hypothetical protein
MNLPAAYLDFLCSGTTVPITDYEGNPNKLRPIAQSALKIEHARATLVGLLGAKKDPHQGMGYYQVPFVNLMRCKDLWANGFGTLVWLPEEQLFGAYDTEHHWFYLFIKTTWEEIQANADVYISILEGEENPKTRPLVPWPKYPWFPESQS